MLLLMSWTNQDYSDQPRWP